MAFAYHTLQPLSVKSLLKYLQNSLVSITNSTWSVPAVVAGPERHRYRPKAY